MEVKEQDGKDRRCRVCFEDNVELDWDNLLYTASNLTYKDCYYKYTQLEYVADDTFSTMLCRNCSKGLKYMDAFVSRAIKTHEKLQMLEVNIIIKNEDSIIQEASNFETIVVEEIDIKPEVQIMCEDYCEEYLGNSTNSTEMSAIPFKKIMRKSRNPTKQATMTKTGESFKDGSTNNKPYLDKNNLLKVKCQPICCSICSKVLVNKYKAILHEKTHRENRERNEECIKCGVKFFNKHTLTLHMRTHVENREKSHKCEFCDKAFYNKGALNVHRRKHLGRMIPCSLCTKEFYRQIDLDLHMASHSAVRITSDIKLKKKFFVRCKDCGENVRSTNFKSHIAKHTNEPLFKCSICNKEFFGRSSSVKHMQRTHKKVGEEAATLIIPLKKERINHLFLQQYSSEKVDEK